MRDEQQPVAREARAEPGVVEGRDHRLARAGRRDNQVAVPVVNRPLRLEPFEDLRLVRVRADLESGHHGRRRRDLVTAERGPQPLRGVLVVGVVVDERGVCPVAVEGAGELANQVRRRHRGQPHVPLQPVHQRGARQVAAADEGGVEAGVAVEEPRLGMQPSRPRLVADLHLSAEPTHERVDGSLLGGSHVRRGDDAERDAAAAQHVQLLLEDPQAVPAHERAEQVDAVGRGELRAQLGAERRLVPGVGDQRRRGQRGDGSFKAVHTGSRLPAEDHEVLRLVGHHLLVQLGDSGQQIVDQREAATGVALSTQGALDELRDVAGEDVGLVGGLDRGEAWGEVGEPGKGSCRGPRCAATRTPLRGAVRSTGSLDHGKAVLEVHFGVEHRAFDRQRGQRGAKVSSHPRHSAPPAREDPTAPATAPRGTSESGGAPSPSSAPSRLHYAPDSPRARCGCRPRPTALGR